MPGPGFRIPVPHPEHSKKAVIPLRGCGLFLYIVAEGDQTDCSTNQQLKINAAMPAMNRLRLWIIIFIFNPTGLSPEPLWLRGRFCPLKFAYAVPLARYGEGTTPLGTEARISNRFCTAPVAL